MKRDPQGPLIERLMDVQVLADEAARARDDLSRRRILRDLRETARGLCAELDGVDTKEAA